MTHQPAALLPDDLGGLLGVPLSREQVAAATAELSPGLIVAGAGSGKTTVMAARVVWLVGTGQVTPAGVLGLTFTNKAAAELLHRIRTALRKLSPRDAEAADDVAVATYHSFAGGLLREFGPFIGLEPSAELMSPVRQRQLAYRIATGPEVDHRLVSGTPHDLAAAILQLDSLLADSDVAAEDLRAFDEVLIASLESRAPQQKTGERMLAAAAARRQLAVLVGSYRRAKADRELLDFADYVRLGAELARRHPEVGHAMRQRHRTVLLDEYQDTSVAQRGMLQALFADGHPVTAVGDPCQAIYGWRGASPHNMDEFPQHFPSRSGEPAPVRTLATNRRSGADILHLANEVAAGLRAVHTGVVQLRPDARNASGTVVCGLLPTIAEELDWLAQRIADCSRPWSDIAVLARTNDAATEVVSVLRRNSIPVQVMGKQALLALPEVRWVVWALRLVEDPTANDALVGLLMGPPWRIGHRDLALLARRAAHLAAADVGAVARDGDAGPERKSGDPAGDLLAALSVDPLDGPCLLDALHDCGDPDRYPYSSAARARMASASALIAGWQRRSGAAAADLVRIIASESGLAAELALGDCGSAPGSPPDDAGLSALMEVARTFDDVERGRTLSDFLAWLKVAEAVPDGPSAPAAPNGNAVTVMTVHAAKGLEFPVVVLPGLVEGSFPNDRGRSLWPTSPGALPVPLLHEPSPESIAGFPADPAFPRASEYTDFAAACRAADRLEEVRLAYVAITRAKEQLIMSGHRWGRSQLKPRQPSEFLLAAATAAAAARAVLDVWAMPPDPGAANPMLAASEAGDVAPDAATGVDWPAIAAAVAAGPVEQLGALCRADAEVIAAWDRDLATVRTELAVRALPASCAVPGELSVSQWQALTRDSAGFAKQLARPVPRPASARAATGEQFHEWVAGLTGQLALWDADDLIDPFDADPQAQHQAALRAAFDASPFAGLQPLAVEHPVALQVHGRVVRGRIDAVFAMADEHWVVDWKTGSTGRADPLQLALYRAAWAAQQGIALERVVGCFVFLAHHRYEVYRALPDGDGLRAIAEGATVALAPTSVVTWQS